MPHSTTITTYRFDELSGASPEKAHRALKKTNARDYIDFAIRKEAALLGFPFAKIRLLRRKTFFIVGIDGELTREQTYALANDSTLASRYDRSASKRYLAEMQPLLARALATPPRFGSEDEREYVRSSTYYEGTPFLVDYDDARVAELCACLLNEEVLERLETIRDEALKGRFDREVAAEYLLGERWRFLKDGTVAAGI